MRTYKIYIQLFGLILIFNLVSCVKNDENYKGYLETGEILYTTKPDSLSTFVGRNRVKIIPFVSNAFSVNEFIVFWNKEKDSKVFPFTKTENKEVDAPELIVTGLEEKTYSFDIYSRDKEGNRSVKVSIFINSYGEAFRSNLTPRPVNIVQYGTEETVFKLKPSANLARSTEVKYTDTDQEERILIVHRDSSTVILERQNNELPISYRTFYVPTAPDEDGNETSIDKFDSDWVEVTVPAFLKEIFADDNFTLTGDVGIVATWNNPNNREIIVTIKFTYSGNLVTDITRSSETDGIYSTPRIDLGTQIINVTISDTGGLSFSKDYEITVIKNLSKISAQANITTNVTSWQSGNTAENIARIIDGDKSTGGTKDYAVHPKSSEGKNITFSFDEHYSAGEFKYYNRAGCCQSKFNGSTITFFKGETEVYSKTIQNAGVIVTVTPGENIVFDKIVITFSKDSDSQNFREIEIFGVSSSVD